MSKPRVQKKFTYYDFSRLLSHNAVYNFCVGGRGLGKTYGAKKLAIRKFLRDGDQFIYLRRYKTELSTRTTFFDDIAHEFPGYGFRVHGFEAQVTRNPETEKPAWETMGYFSALSTAQTKKSVAYPRVTLIIFDEFIIEKGAIHYLPREEIVMMNFYSTVDRWQDKTKVLFLANSVTIMNPYFMAYNVKPDREWLTMNDGFIACHFADSKEFANEVLETRFGKFIKGTEYEEYAVMSVFADNHDYLVARKGSDAKYFATIETIDGSFSVWRSVKEYPETYFVQESRPKKEIVLTLEADLMAEGKIYVARNDKLLQLLRAAFSRGSVMFDGPRVRNHFAHIIRR